MIKLVDHMIKVNEIKNSGQAVASSHCKSNIHDFHNIWGNFINFTLLNFS